MGLSDLSEVIQKPQEVYVRTLNPVFKRMMVFIFVSCQSAGTKTHLWSFPHRYFLYYQQWASPKTSPRLILKFLLWYGAKKYLGF